MVGYAPSMSNELAILAGGDDHELAVEEVKGQTKAAWANLKQAHPFFFPEESPCVSSSPVPSPPVPRQSPQRSPSSRSSRRTTSTTRTAPA